MFPEYPAEVTAAESGKLCHVIHRYFTGKVFQAEVVDPVNDIFFFCIRCIFPSGGKSQHEAAGEYGGILRGGKIIFHTPAENFPCQ